MIEKNKAIYKRIGKNIRKLRKRADSTQEQLAEKSPKLDRAKISNMENGKEDLCFSTLLEITNGLEVDVELLMKREG